MLAMLLPATLTLPAGKTCQQFLWPITNNKLKYVTSVHVRITKDKKAYLYNFVITKQENLNILAKWYQLHYQIEKESGGCD